MHFRFFLCLLDRAAGGTLDQLRMQQQGANINVVYLAGESIQCASTQILTVLPDGGQRGQGVATKRDVVKAHDADVLRDTQAS